MLNFWKFSNKSQDNGRHIKSMCRGTKTYQGFSNNIRSIDRCEVVDIDHLRRNAFVLSYLTYPMGCVSGVASAGEIINYYLFISHCGKYISESYCFMSFLTITCPSSLILHKYIPALNWLTSIAIFLLPTFSSANIFCPSAL